MKIGPPSRGEQAGGQKPLLADFAPRCPQLRSCTSDWLYPVGGVCILSYPPGYMLPSIEEFRTYCTTRCFEECPWFVTGPAEQDPIRRERSD
jgi:hypothetical protein